MAGTRSGAVNQSDGEYGGQFDGKFDHKSAAAARGEAVGARVARRAGAFSPGSAAKDFCGRR